MGRFGRRGAALLYWLAAPLALTAGVAPVVAAAEAPAAQADPQQLMTDISKRMFEALDSNRAAIKKEPEKVYPLVDSILLPHFDTAYAAQLVLAQNWKAATPEQRKRFIDALYKALLRTYGGPLADFTADRLKVPPFRPDPAAKHAPVPTLVTRSSGVVVPVDYVLHKTDAGWKAFDVVIEGISYVRNYRTDLGAEISQKGLDEVIARLEREGLKIKDVAAIKPAGSSAAQDH
jgi:phospholipid transport system substrate-binding protein